MQALSLLDERARPEWAAFAATLARRMAELLPQQLVGLGDPVWAACVDRFLLTAVDIDSQVAAPHCNDDCTYLNCDGTSHMHQVLQGYGTPLFASSRELVLQLCDVLLCCVLYTVLAAAV